MVLIERDNMVLIPAAFSPHGHTGPLFNRLMLDTTPNITEPSRTDLTPTSAKILHEAPEFHMTY